MISQNSKQALRNPWFIGIVAMMAVVLGVNGAFIWLSVQNRPALVDRDYTTKSRKSDTAALKDIEAQRALAWQVSVMPPGNIAADTPLPYEIGVADRAGAPVSGAMEVIAYRASDASRDFMVAFRETSAGRYQGHLFFPLKGYWELRIRVRRGEETFETNTGRFMVAAVP